MCTQRVDLDKRMLRRQYADKSNIVSAGLGQCFDEMAEAISRVAGRLRSL